MIRAHLMSLGEKTIFVDQEKRSQRGQGFIGCAGIQKANTSAT